jgi:hypothetical protein
VSTACGRGIKFVDIKNLNRKQEVVEVTNEIVETSTEHEQLWKATSQVLRGQVSEAVWF